MNKVFESMVKVGAELVVDDSPADMNEVQNNREPMGSGDLAGTLGDGHVWDFTNLKTVENRLNDFRPDFLFFDEGSDCVGSVSRNSGPNN